MANNMILILLLLLVILVILLAINICLIFKNTKKYGGMESEYTSPKRLTSTELTIPEILTRPSVDEVIQYLGNDIYQIPEIVIDEITHSEHNFFNPTDRAIILNSSIIQFCFIKKFYLSSPCYILLTYQKTIGKNELNLVSKEYLDINRNTMVPNSSIEQSLTKEIPKNIKLSELKYNKMDDTILLEYKLLPINDDRIIFDIEPFIDNGSTDTSSSVVQYNIVSSNLYEIIIILDFLVPDIDELSYYMIIRLSSGYRVLSDNIKKYIHFNTITNKYEYNQINYTYFTDLEKDHESTEIVYDENYDIISFRFDDVIYVSDILPTQLNVTSDVTSDVTSPLFNVKDSSGLIFNFISKFLSSFFITNYNLYQFLIVLNSYSISSKKSTFYKLKLIEFINFTFKSYTIEDRLKIIQLITNNLWESESVEFIRQIFTSLNDAFVLYVRAQRDHNLFDCSDRYGHGIVPEINAFNTIVIVDDSESTLGRGVSSIVQTCALSSNLNYHYAFKHNCCDSPEIVLRLNHPFIVKYFKANSSTCILELCYSIPLFYINMKQLIIQLIFALTYLESLSITHGDLHINNMMIGRDGYLRLIDFDRSLTPSNTDYIALKDLLIGNGAGTGIMNISPPLKGYIVQCRENKDTHIEEFVSILESSFKFKDLKDSNWIKITNGNSNYYDFLIQKETLGI